MTKNCLFPLKWKIWHEVSFWRLHSVQKFWKTRSPFWKNRAFTSNDIWKQKNLSLTKKRGKTLRHYVNMVLCLLIVKKKYFNTSSQEWLKSTNVFNMQSFNKINSEYFDFLWCLFSSLCRVVFWNSILCTKSQACAQIFIIQILGFWCMLFFDSKVKWNRKQWIK